MTRTTRRFAIRSALTLLWVVIAFVYLFPYIWMVLTGIRRPIDSISMPPRFIFSPSLDGFRLIFGQVHFGSYLAHSLIVALSATAAVLVIAAPAAYAMAQLRMRGGIFLGAVLVARMVPGVSILVPIYLAASGLGVLDTFGLLIVVYTAFNLPFAIWLMRGFFRDVPAEIREAAIVDGGTEWQVFTRMVLPLITGGAVATAVFVFIASWNEFLFALALTNAHTATAPLSVVGFRNELGVQWDAIGASALVISTPVVLFAIAMQRYLVRGLTMGSVKG